MGQRGIPKRIGGTVLNGGTVCLFRPTTVHRFLIDGTIEERMHSAMTLNGSEQWNRDCVTIGQLKDLFIVPGTTVNGKNGNSSDAEESQEPIETTRDSEMSNSHNALISSTAAPQNAHMSDPVQDGIRPVSGDSV